MANELPILPARLRHYITLATQAVPLIGLLVLNGRNFHPIQLLIVGPLAMTAVGPILELNGRRWGRFVTLTGLSLQIAGMLAVLAMVMALGGNMRQIRASDLAFFTLILPPLMLLIWNWWAGRERPAMPSD